MTLPNVRIYMDELLIKIYFCNVKSMLKMVFILIKLN